MCLLSRTNSNCQLCFCFAIGWSLFNSAPSQLLCVLGNEVINGIYERNPIDGLQKPSAGSPRYESHTHLKQEVWFTHACWNIKSFECIHDHRHYYSQAGQRTVDSVQVCGEEIRDAWSWWSWCWWVCLCCLSFINVILDIKHLMHFW